MESLISLRPFLKQVEYFPGPTELYIISCIFQRTVYSVQSSVYYIG